MSTRKREPPIWTEPAPGSRKPKLTRDQIAEVALKIADREGFEAVSMRRIADELDVGTMTLYHYMRTKDDLVALMDDAIMAKVLVPPAQLATDWRTAVTAIAMGSYRAFRAHPWAIDALRGARFGPNGVRHFEQSLASVANAPFDLAGRLDILGIVDDYVFGHVFRSVDRSHHQNFEDGRPSKAVIWFMEDMIATGEFPHMAALVHGDDAIGAWTRMATFMNDEKRFERGLEMLLDGIAARASEPSKPRRARSRRRASRAK